MVKNLIFVKNHKKSDKTKLLPKFQQKMYIFCHFMSNLRFSPIDVISPDVNICWFDIFFLKARFQVLEIIRVFKKCLKHESKTHTFHLK